MPTQKTDRILLEATIDRAFADKANRTASLSFSSEEPIRDWPGSPPHVLLHSGRSADFSRLLAVGSVLFNHNADRIVGSIEEAWVEKESRRGKASIKFDETEDGQLAWDRVLSGSLRGVSVSAIPIERRQLEEGESWEDGEGRKWEGPLVVSTRWQAVEMSLTPIPADASVGVGRKIQQETDMAINAATRKLLISLGMPEGLTDEEAQQWMEDFKPEAKKEPAAKRSDDNKLDPLDAEVFKQRLHQAEEKGKLEARRAAEAERDRVKELRAIREKSGMEDRELDRWIVAGVSPDVARQEAMEFVAERYRPIGKGGQRVELVMDARDKHRKAMENHLLRRSVAAGHIKAAKKPIEIDHSACEGLSLDFSLLDVARDCLVQAGIREARSWGKQEIINRAFQHSTSDFPYLLGNVANKSLGVGYAETRTTWDAWCGVGSLTDFKTANRIAVGDLGAFEVVKELMPITETTVSEKYESRSLSTYAKRFGVSRQALINDDLSEFTRIPMKLGASAARTVNTLVYQQLTSPPTMVEDATALFATTHTSGSNYVSSGGGAPSATTLNGMFPLFRKQKGVGATATLNLTPRFIIVPAALEGATRSLLTATYMPTASTGALTSYMLNLVPVVEPLLDATSAAVWYMACDPNEIDTIMVEFLNGQQTPSLITMDGTAILGTEWIAYLDFSVKVFDHRGLAKNIGTA